MYNKFLLSGLFLSLFISFAFASTQTLLMEGPGDLKNAYHIGNWDNMDEDCVYLNKEDRLIINFKLYFYIDDLDQYEPIHYSTNFNGNGTQTYGPIDADELTPYTETEGFYGQNPNIGTNLYVFEHQVYNEIYTQECLDDLDGKIPFDFRISLLDQAGNPYPIEDNMGLFATPPQGNGISMTNYTEYVPALIYAGVVEICCDGPPQMGRLLAQNNNWAETKLDNNKASLASDSTIPSEINFATTSLVEKDLAYPNPFNQVLNLKFHGAASQTTQIQLWDINGRLIHQMNYFNEGEGVQQASIDTRKITEGIYFCKINNNTTVKTLKVIKSN